MCMFTHIYVYIYIYIYTHCLYFDPGHPSGWLL